MLEDLDGEQQQVVEIESVLIGQCLLVGLEDVALQIGFRHHLAVPFVFEVTELIAELSGGETLFG